MTPDLNTQNITLRRFGSREDPLNLNFQALAECAAVIPGHQVIVEGSDAAFGA